MSQNNFIGIFLLLQLCNALPSLLSEHEEVYPELSAGYTEGDIIYYDSDISSRNALRDEKYRWPNGTVYYKFGAEIDKLHREWIREAMRLIEQQSCIVFTPASANQKYYVNVTTGHRGCFSAMGFRQRVQAMSLAKAKGRTGCYRSGTLLHELLHTLGFEHQHNAPNRDDYVKILKANVRKGKLHNFDKRSSKDLCSLGQEYDYASIMHYPDIAFGTNGTLTILALKEGAQQLMGQRKALSEGDVRKLNAMYNCRAVGAKKMQVTTENIATL